MQFKQIVFLAAALLPLASSVVGAPTPVTSVVGEDGIAKRACVIQFTYAYCGKKEGEDDADGTTYAAVETTDAAVQEA